MTQLGLFSARPELPEAEEGAFLFCPQCGAAHRVSRADRAPLHALDGSSRMMDDFAAFLARHDQHPLKVLRRSMDLEMHTHARHDPMCRVLWEASDEEGNRFVVSFGRDDVESPRRYVIHPGRLVVETEKIQLDGELLREIVDEALYPHAVPDSKLTSFIRVCSQRVVSVPWERFEPVDEDREDPDTQLACLPATVLAEITSDVRAFFSGEDVRRLLELFANELRDEIPVVRLRRTLGTLPP